MSDDRPVVLLHGLARSHRSMARLGRFLRKHGRRTWARTYPSRRLPVDALAERVAGWIEQEFGDEPVDAVTHSLGGILVRHMAERVRFGRVVMLAPPNQGSELAGKLRDFGPFALLYGPAGQDVATARAEAAQQVRHWPVPDVPVGVIAGTASPTVTNPISWLSGGLRVFGPDRPNDGTVAVDETFLPGMAAFGTVPASHTFIMDHATARAWTRDFLHGGTFPPSDTVTDKDTDTDTDTEAQDDNAAGSSSGANG